MMTCWNILTEKVTITDKQWISLVTVVNVFIQIVRRIKITTLVNE